MMKKQIQRTCDVAAYVGGDNEDRPIGQCLYLNQETAPVDPIRNKAAKSTVCGRRGGGSQLELEVP